MPEEKVCPLRDLDGDFPAYCCESEEECDIWNTQAQKCGLLILLKKIKLRIGDK